MHKSTELNVTLRPLVERLKTETPFLRLTIANASLIKGKTTKGIYEIMVIDQSAEIHTTFLRKNGNPLLSTQLLSRTHGEAENAFDDHIAAIKANEQKFPLIEKKRDAESGDEYVTVYPFATDERAPRIIVRTSARTGIVSMDINQAQEMSPVEARLVGEALIRACDIASPDLE